MNKPRLYDLSLLYTTDIILDEGAWFVQIKELHAA